MGSVFPGQFVQGLPTVNHAKENAMTKYHLTLTAFAICLLPLVTHAQVQLVGEHLNNPTPPEITTIGQRPVIYLPVEDDSPVLYFTPFFVFEETPEGDLKVDVSEPLTDANQWSVQLTVLVSPNWLLDSMALEVNKWAKSQTDEKYRRYESIDAKTLIPTEFTFLSIKESNQNPIFEPIVRTDLRPQQPITIEAHFDSQEQAEAAAKKLRERRTRLNFVVSYRLYARLTVSESKASVSSISISNSDAVKSLTGAGRAFSVSKNTDELRIGDKSLITREQFERFSALLRNEIAADYDIENDNDLEFVDRKMQEFLETRLPEQEFAFDRIRAVMRALSSYSFSASDLSPDRITRIANEAKQELSKKEHEKVSFSGSASASYLGFGGSASVSHSRDSLKEMMEKKGWTFGADVNAYVPKSLKVHVVDRSKLETEFAINVKVKRRLRLVPSFGADLSTAKGFSDKSAEQGAAILTGKNFARELAFIEERVQNAQKEIGTLQTLASQLESGALKYYSVDEEVATNTPGKFNPHVAATVKRYKVEAATKIAAVWHEIVDSVNEQGRHSQIEPKVEGNDIVVTYRAMPNQPGTVMRVRFHALYYPKQ